MTKRIASILLGSLLPLLHAGAQESASDNRVPAACPTVRIEAERLPDLNVPRFGHSVISVNGEITVFGGHTKGFVPTATAEYYSDGQWHLLQMVYAHDAGCTLPLKSGKVLVAGGFEKHLGIGQTHVVEMYDPISHSFEGFGCMDKKRTMFTALELDSGRVILSGNWYHDDAVEIFDGIAGFSSLKDVSQQRVFPHIFRIATDDAIIFGSRDPWGHPLDSIVVDRLKGESFSVPLFKEWKPVYACDIQRSANSFIGDEDKGHYAYLLTVEDSSGQMAIARAEGTAFSLLPTTCPVPMQGPWGKIVYYAPILVDRKAQRGYLLGGDDDNLEQSRHYILCIEYGKALEGGAAPLTLYYTDPMPDMANTSAVVTDEGDLLLVGGKPCINTSDNFRPSSSVVLLHFGSLPIARSEADRSWQWIVVAIVGLLIFLLGIFLYRHRRSGAIVQEPEERGDGGSQQLLQRICDLIENEKLYLDSDLKISDIATRLDTHRNTISACINSQKGCSFAQFINAYRIEYAKALIRRETDAKLNHVAVESGFSNETSFFRSFKALTGMTPTEWKAKID